MPVVTIDPNEYERYELKTAPANPNDPDDEQGFVMLRPLPYGLKLKRLDGAGKMVMRSQPTGKKNSKLDDAEIELESSQEWAVAFDFQHCIGDHNLTDRNGQKLDFTRPFAIKLMNPRVGEEIQQLIDSLNNFEDDEELEDFPMRSPSYSDDPTELNPTSESHESLETPVA